MGDSSSMEVEKRALQEDESAPGYPCKKFFRSRAHCNPLSHNDAFDYPRSPAYVDWSEYYPKHGRDSGGRIANLDVGCGFGGLSIALATLAPEELTLALEIRSKVCEFVRRRIESLRTQNSGSYDNVACMRTNSMLYLANTINKGQLRRIFFCFPDPHFKAKNHRRRVVSTALLAEYAYALAGGGLLYCVTDVLELHEWHVAKCDAHPAFERVPDRTEATDPYVRAIVHDTEEGKKVARAGGDKYFAVYRRRRDEEMPPTKLWPDLGA